MANYQFLFKTPESIEAILTELKHAKLSIDIELFYVLDDHIGKSLLEILLKKARDGVKVRIILDAMGSFGIGRSMYIKELKKAGAHVRFFNTLFPFAKTAKSLWYFRNHRRTIIIDGHTLIVGSICFGEPTQHWIEGVLILKNSSSIIQATKTFDTTWRKIHRKSFKIGHADQTSLDEFTYLTQAPLQRRRTLYRLLINKIRSCSEHIILVAPYLIPDHRLLRAIRGARRRKVRIQIIVPKITDSRLADLARNSYIAHFLRYGCEVYFADTMLHAKITIFDTSEALIGTLNLDNVSLRYNYECAVYIQSKDTVHDLVRDFFHHISPHIHKVHTHEWKKRGVWEKFLERCVWIFRKFL